MNNLFKHIEYLLLRNDCVIVPGFGAFIATNLPARIDYEKGEILPPVRQVMFNQAVSMEDGLLANSYVRKSGVSFDDARQIIAREVGILKSFLAEKRVIQVGNLGSLLLGQEDNVIFKPGLKAVSSVIKEGFPVVYVHREAEEVIGQEPVIDKVPFAENNEPAISSHGYKTEDSYYRFKVRKTLSKVAVAVVLSAVLALTFMLNPLPSGNHEQRASVVPVEALIPSRNCETTKIDSAVTVVEEEIRKEESLPAHYLIVATFKSEIDANSYVEKYSTDEFPLISVPSKKVTRVAVAFSDDKVELLSRLNSTQILSRFPYAWVWSRI